MVVVVFTGENLFQVTDGLLLRKQLTVVVEMVVNITSLSIDILICSLTTSSCVQLQLPVPTSWWGGVYGAGVLVL